VIPRCLGGGHPAVELSFEVLGLARVFVMIATEIVHAKFRDLSLLLVVCGVGFDLEGDPRVCHCAVSASRKKCSCFFLADEDLQDKVASGLIVVPSVGVCTVSVVCVLMRKRRA